MPPREVRVRVALRGEQPRRRRRDDLALLDEHGAGAYLFDYGGNLRSHVVLELHQHLAVGLERRVHDYVEHLEGDVALRLRQSRLLEVLPYQRGLLLAVGRFVEHLRPYRRDGLAYRLLRRGALLVVDVQQRRVEELRQPAVLQKLDAARHLGGYLLVLHHDGDYARGRALAQLERRRLVLVARRREREVGLLRGEPYLVVLLAFEEVPVEADEQRRDAEQYGAEYDVLPVLRPV